MLVIITPAKGAGPFDDVNTGDWKKAVETEIAEWKKDPKRVMVLPYPVDIHQVHGVPDEVRVG